jgi:short-subunit dehydrogenase
MKEKVVWITGASSGIGEALALQFAKEGANLVLSARRIAELERVKQATGLADEKILLLPFDVQETEKAAEKAQMVIQYFGHIDVLVNNAGVTQRAYFKDMTMETIRRMMEINFFGNIALTKAVLPYFLVQKSGSIVVISSVTGKFGTPLRTLYAASKHALHGFYDALRAENWKDNLHILLVCPGYIQTQISFNALTANGEKHNQLDEGQKKGMLASVCAAKISKALAAKKNEIYPAGFKELLAVYLKRFFPALLNRLVRKANVT